MASIRNDFYHRHNIIPHGDEPTKSSTDEPGFKFWDWQPRQDCTWVKVLKEWNIHGMKYIAQPDRHVFERLFWGVTLLISLAVAVYLSYQIFDVYNKSPIIMSFEPSQTSIAQIPFPAVTICNVNRIRKSAVMNALKIVTDDTIDNETRGEYVRLLITFDHICETKKCLGVRFGYGLNEITVSLKNRSWNIPYNLFNGVFMSKNESVNKMHNDVFRESTQTCKEMILLCMWEGEEKSCSEMFTNVYTNFGLCCTFNMMPRRILLKQKAFDHDERNMSNEELEKWEKFNMDENMLDTDDSWNTGGHEEQPKRQSKAGETSGLSFMVNPELDDYFCGNHNGFGFRVLTHSPIDFPHVTEFGMAVSPGLEVFMSVQAKVTTADASIELMSSGRRHCYYADEHPLEIFRYYTTSNCMDECIQNITRETCSCQRFDLPHAPIFRPCTEYFGGNCSRGIEEMIFNNGIQQLCPQCLPGCNEIQYLPQVSSLELNNDERMWMRNGIKPPWTGKNVSIIHIFLGSDNVYARVRSSLYTGNDLFAHVGGILGLCLGFSVMSVIEPLYFLIRSWFNCEANDKMEEEIEALSEGSISPDSDDVGLRKEPQSEDLMNYYYRNGRNSQVVSERGLFPFTN